MRVGLTGGIASGKTTVANLFAELDVPVIDTDIIARELVEPGEPALKALAQAFGTGILDNQGRLDRKRMRVTVFSDEKKRKKLESILHPLIAAKMLAVADQAGGDYQILVIPLLFETGMNNLVDRVLVVDCSPQIQFERLIARDSETAAGARRILDAQIDRASRIAQADDLIVNDGDIDALRASVRDLHKAYLSRVN